MLPPRSGRRAAPYPTDARRPRAPVASAYGTNPGQPQVRRRTRSLRRSLGGWTASSPDSGGASPRWTWCCRSSSPPSRSSSSPRSTRLAGSWAPSSRWWPAPRWCRAGPGRWCRAPRRECWPPRSRGSPRRSTSVATPILLVVVAVYSLARWVPDLRGLLGVALVALTILGDYTFRDLRDADFTDVIFVLSLMTPPYFFGRVARKMTVQAEQLRAAGADPRPGGPRGAGPDRPRAARRHRALGQRDGGADGRGPGPGPRPIPAAPSGCCRQSRRPAGRRSPKPVGCCT